MNEHVESLLVELIETMQQQTEAINALAASNMALVQTMAEGDGSGEAADDSHSYLDGRRQ